MSIYHTLSYSDNVTLSHSHARHRYAYLIPAMGGAVASASPPGSPHWMGMAPVVIQPMAGMPLSPPVSDSDAYAATYTHGEGTERGDHSHQPQGDREAENGRTAASHTDIEASMSSLKVCCTCFFAACVSSSIFIVAFTCCHTPVLSCSMCLILYELVSSSLPSRVVTLQCCRAAYVSSSTSSYLHHRCLHVLSHSSVVVQHVSHPLRARIFIVAFTCCHTLHQCCRAFACIPSAVCDRASLVVNSHRRMMRHLRASPVATLQV
jgi:hypothetical protein